MHRGSIVVLGAFVGGGMAYADLPNTMNFRNVTASKIVGTVAEAATNEKEVELGDFDEDGQIDVVIGNALSDFGTKKNKLYRNNAGVLQEVSGAPVITGFTTADVTRNVFFRDFTGDGHLDIYVINDGNTAGTGGWDKLFVNQWPNGGVWAGGQTWFIETSLTTLMGPACGGVAVDFDGDNDWDVWEGNYPNSSQDRCFRNNGAGAFSEALSLTYVPNDGDYTVDVASGDVNGDGKIDLILSSWDANEVYYNNNLNAGSALGDFLYTNSVQALGATGANENAKEPGDFDNDGDLDIYWGDGSGTVVDVILRNNGNSVVAPLNQAIWQTVPLAAPLRVSTTSTRKQTMADFDSDGDTDIVVMSETGRPVVLRNVGAANNSLKFLDWTPGDEFPGTTVHSGWHAAVADTNNDGREDIIAGGMNGDHLFEGVISQEYTEAGLPGGVVGPAAVFNNNPVAIEGDAPAGGIDTYTVNGVLAGHFAAVVHGPDDYLLEILDTANVVVATANIAGLGGEEGAQVVTVAGSYKARVTVVASDCTLEDADFNDDCTVGFSDMTDLLINWGCSGCQYDIDGAGGAGFSDLTELLLRWGATSNDYIVEILARSS